MQKGFRIAPIILLGTFVIGLALYCVWPRERSYQGRTLNQWLEEYYTVWNNIRDWEQQRKDEERFAALGPAVVPDLVRVLESRSSSRLEYELAQFLFRFPATTTMGSWLRSRGIPAQNRRLEANYLLGLLGPQAESAIPTMIRIYQNTNEPNLVRGSIPYSLGRIHRRADLVVPALAQALSDLDPVSDHAATALREFGTNSISTIPALRQALHHPIMLNALMAAQAIQTIDPEASLAAMDEVMPVLVKALESGDRLPLLFAIPLLAQYGARAKAAAPALVKIQEEGDVGLRWQAAEVLKKIDPDAAATAGAK